MDKKRAASKAPAKPAPWTVRPPDQELRDRVHAAARALDRSDHWLLLTYIKEGLAADEAQNGSEGAGR
jgi:hypothetical protein